MRSCCLRAWSGPLPTAAVWGAGRGLTRVGIYVPGGTAAYPSSVLMNAVPAKVAGVGGDRHGDPPQENLSDAVLAAAKIAGGPGHSSWGAGMVAALTYKGQSLSLG